MMNTLIKNKFVVAMALSGVLVGCGSDSDDNNSGTANFTFGVSDAPVTVAEEVMVCFNTVELVGNGADPVTFTIGEDGNTVAANDACLDEEGEVVANTRGINLLEVTGSDSENLVNNAEIPAGNYGQLRLEIGTGSYVMVDGEKLPLRVPSNELKLIGVTIAAAGEVNYTLEFDLRKALVDPVGQDGYLLKPTGLRLVDNSEIGHLEGTVAESLLLNNECPVAPDDISAPVASVYLYQGADVALEDMADNGGSEEVEPYASTNVFFDGAANYNFEIGFITAGDYTAAVTCDDDADPEADDDVSFLEAETVTIEATQQPATVELGAE
ncbi:protein of unknown function [Pseudidiomarina planktonica]|uniref:DUF4382 domain-containing protein n=1 Tax=Pseudidiomarina planktonica TaxID=1323738 RepID=A0A1Y6F176_9GAMM|nr:DUF4382 domain-containing protein [Pseudidiomarina planktonica]RUO65012.1 DUF4382 domain-containing protein [Pseudidiomarina planktonica]SMQ68595.1 protein of unknown function [Pseudidiomarina planktonica]